MQDVHGLALVYAAICDGQKISSEELQLGSDDLQQLCRLQENMRSNSAGAIEVSIQETNPVVWRAVCPVRLRQAVLWQAQGPTHASPAKTIREVQRWWNWLKMKKEIRRSIKTCETCERK